MDQGLTNSSCLADHRNEVEDQSAPPGETFTVLVADDDDLIRLLVERILARQGYKVILAEDGRQALELIRTHLPDIVLLDCQMPYIDGFEVCRQLHQIPETKDTPVIFLTAMSEPINKAKGFKTGGVDYIIKPVESTEMIARIRTHLDLARTRARLRQQAKLLEGVVKAQSGRLDKVRSGQECLLADPGQFKDIKTGVCFQPAQEAGGDFYEIVQLSDTDYGLLIADVSGHDLGVAYITGALKALVASFACESLSVQETMVLLNGALKKFLSPGLYITACYVKFSTANPEADIIVAGHPAPIIQRAGGDLHYLNLTGDVLGIFDSVTCNAQSLTFGPGDRLFLYTDGLIDSIPNPAGEYYDHLSASKQLLEEIVSRKDYPLAQAIETLVDEVTRKCEIIKDDIVLMGVEF